MAEETETTAETPIKMMTEAPADYVPPVENKPKEPEETVAAEGGEDTVVADEGEDTVAAGAADDTGAIEPEPTPTFDRTAYNKAIEDRTKAMDALKAVDDRLDALEASFEDGSASLEDQGKATVLAAKRNRIERQLADAERSVAGQERAIQSEQNRINTAAWGQVGKKYAAVADTHDKAVKVCFDAFQDEIAKAAKERPQPTGMPDAEYRAKIAGLAEGRWENRMAVLIAKGHKKPEVDDETPVHSLKKPMSPRTGAADAGGKKLSAAEIVRQQLGPLEGVKLVG